VAWNNSGGKSRCGNQSGKQKIRETLDVENKELTTAVKQ
jgi:hypothetical protein